MKAEEWWDLLGRRSAGWNDWRRRNPDTRVDLRELYLKDEDLSYYDLSGANLRGASLRGAYLDGANLRDADMREAHLTHAKLRNADLTGADLRGAVMRNTFLYDAILLRVDFSGAILRDSYFDRAQLGWTVFGYTDLHSVRNLETTILNGPVSIGLDTLLLSRWRVPRHLLLQPNLHPDIVAAIERWAGKAESYHTCFLSHSSLDRDVATRLYNELRMDGVPVWYSAECLNPGEQWRDELQENLKRAGRLLVIISNNALTSCGVRDEMTTFLGTAPEAMSRVIPIKLIEDDAWKSAEVSWVADIRDSVHALDLQDSRKTYEQHYFKLLESLKL